MPGHWDLPGEKPLAQESFTETFKRKLLGDLGISAEPTEIFKIEELLIDPGITVLMYIFTTNFDTNQFSGEAEKPTWMTRDQIYGMETCEFTEYYNRQLLIDYFDNPSPTAPVNVINTLKYFQMDQNEDYQRWLNSGKKS